MTGARLDGTRTTRAQDGDLVAERGALPAAPLALLRIVSRELAAAVDAIPRHVDRVFGLPARSTREPVEPLASAVAGPEFDAASAFAYASAVVLGGHHAASA
ncbi:MAG: hypothetical protein ACPGWS_09255 [Solirubrobacterales bacterium]